MFVFLMSKKSIIGIISSIFDKRPVAEWRLIDSICSSVRTDDISEEKKPGAIALIRIFLSPSSLARDLVNASIAPFVAEYTDSPEYPRAPQIEDISYERNISDL